MTFSRPRHKTIAAAIALALILAVVPRPIYWAWEHWGW
jgi:hypothetical protein